MVSVFFFGMLHDASPVLPVRDRKSEHFGDLQFVSLLVYGIPINFHLEADREFQIKDFRQNELIQDTNYYQI